MSFALYIVGLLLLVGGIAWGLTIAGLAPVYIGIACVIVLGQGDGRPPFFPAYAALAAVELASDEADHHDFPVFHRINIYLYV
jgi:hypothetical protein